MQKFVMVKETSAWRDVTWAGFAEDGGVVENRIRVRFVSIGRAEYLKLFGYDPAPALTASEIVARDRRVFDRIVRAWEGPADEAGSPVSMADPFIDQMLDVPGFVGALGEAYVDFWHGREDARRGNSVPSPAAGLAETTAAAAATDTATR